MDTDDYLAFQQLAQTLHFGRAARSLGMSPSALTRRVQGIEEELGQVLLLRDNKQVQLTRSGELFRSFAQHQTDQLEELKNQLRQEEESPSGELLVACTVTACHTLLPKLLGRLRRDYPGVTLRLLTQDAGRSLAQLEAGEVDLAVIPAEPDGVEGLSSIPLGRTEFALIAPPSDDAIDAALASSPPALGQLPFVAPLSGLERSRLRTWFKLQGHEPRIVAEVRGNEGIIAMVSLGSGVALVPELVLSSSPLESEVRRVSGIPLPPGYDVALCAKPRTLERRVARVLWDLAADAQRGGHWCSPTSSAERESVEPIT